MHLSSNGYSCVNRLIRKFELVGIFYKMLDVSVLKRYICGMDN